MSAPLAPLPPGWITQWDPTAGRNVFVETATGRTSYVPPTASAGPSPRPTHPTGAARMSLPPMTSPPAFRGGPSPTPIMGPGAPVPPPAPGAPAPPIGPGSPPASIGPGSRRRAYPTAHLAANSVSYSGGFDPGAQINNVGGYGGMQPSQPSISEQAGGSTFFTPAMPDQNQVPPQAGDYGQQQPLNPAMNSPYGTQNGQGQQVNAGYPGQQAGGMGGLTNQFAGMGMGAQQGSVQKNPLYTVNLSNALPQIADLDKGPPAIQLPPNACISSNPKANAHPSYHRSTLNAIPTTHSLLQKSKLPLGVILSPYRSVREEDGDDPVPLVTDSVIARCRRCRTYINPYVTFIEGGNRWKCCMCNISNEVPQQFDWDPEKNQPADRWKRHELNHSVVEFVAPREYMVRPPQPPVYTFLIDVSHHAIQSGMVNVAAKTILETLDKLPNADDRTRICIIGVDTSLHFFCLPVGSTEPEMLVVSDLDDVFLPKPHDLLVNLTEGRAGIESLLSRLGEMFADNNVIGSALGAALQAAYKLVSPTGGKIMCLTASLPSVGPGALKNREDPKLLGTSKESQLLQAASTFYKTFPIDCSRSQVSVDMWLFGSGYSDVATLSCLPRYTGGQTYFYPAFHAGREEDAKKFSHEFAHVLASPICYEAVLRLRMTKGLRATSFHGNFFVRSTDLLALPAVPLDQSYAIECEIEETINSPFVVFQSVVMHSTSYGERRLRVTNLALPTTTSLSEVYSSADQVAIITLLANKAVERSIHHRLEDARDALMNKLVDIFSTYKSTMTSAGSGASPQLSIASNMNLLPILTLALLKHVGIRASPQIPSDLRAYAQALLTTLPTQLLIPYLHPNFYCLHNMAPEAGTRQPVPESESNNNSIKEEEENEGENGQASKPAAALGKVIFPQKLNLSSERLERHGLYLIEDGQNIFLWVGRDAVPQLCIDVFDVPSYAALKGGKTTLPVLSNSMNQRVNTLVDEIRRMRRGPYRPHLYIIKEDGEPSLRLWALSQLIEDRFEQSNSYMQFLGTLRDKVNGGSS